MVVVVAGRLSVVKKPASDDVYCRYASDADFQVSVRGIPAGIKDVMVIYFLFV